MVARAENVGGAKTEELRARVSRLTRGSNAEDVFFIAILIGFVLLQGMMFLNRSLPPMGVFWNDLNVYRLLNGEKPYVDFYYYVPLGNLIRSVWLMTVSGGNIVAYRFFYLCERALLFCAMYFLLRRFFARAHAFIGCAVSSVLVATTKLDQFGNYNQTYRLYLLLAAIFLVRFFQQDDLWARVRNTFVAGLILGIVFTFKQSIGMLAPLFFLILLAFYCLVARDRRFLHYLISALLGFLMPIVIMMVYVISIGAFTDFFDQVFKGSASAKGSFGGLLFRFWRNTFRIEYLSVSAGPVALYVIGVIERDYQPAAAFSHSWQDYVLKSLLVMFSLAMIVLRYFASVATIVNAILESAHSYIAYILFILIVLPAFICLTMHYGSTRRIKSDRQLQLLIGAIAALLLIVSVLAPFDMPISEVVSLDKQAAIFTNRVKEDLPVLMTHVIIVMMIETVIRVLLQDDRTQNLKLLVLLMAVFASVYETGMSTSATFIGYISVSLTGPVAICWILSLPGSASFKRAKDGAVFLYCLFAVSLGVIQMISVPYAWWGYTALPLAPENQYSVNVRGLEGFRMSFRDKMLYEKTVQLIETYTDEEDEILCFPHVPVLSVLSDRTSWRSFATSYYPDTCPDWVARQDLAHFKANLPKVVVLCDVGELMWNYNEAAFRKGEQSGQREFSDWLNKIIKKRYTRVGSIATIKVYRLKDGKHSQIKYRYRSAQENDYSDEQGQKRCVFDTLINGDNQLSPKKMVVKYFLFAIVCIVIYCKDKTKQASLAIKEILVATVFLPMYGPMLISCCIPLAMIVIDGINRKKGYQYWVAVACLTAMTLMGLCSYAVPWGGMYGLCILVLGFLALQSNMYIK